MRDAPRDEVQHRDPEGKVLPSAELEEGQTSTPTPDKRLLTELEGCKRDANALLLQAVHGPYVPGGTDARFDPLIRLPSVAPANSTESKDCVTEAEAASLQGVQGGAPSGTDTGCDPLTRVPSAEATPANSNDLERRSIQQKLVMELGPIPTKDKNHDAQLYAEIHFIVDGYRVDSGRYMINLVTDQADFGVTSLCTGTGCPSNCRARSPIVIKQFTIEVIPLLVYPCHRVWAEPHKVSETFIVQDTRSVGFQLGHPRQTVLSIGFGKSISRTVLAHEWDAVRSARENESVTLNWIQNSDIKGKKIEVGKFKVGRIPKLAIQNDFIHMPPGHVLGKGFWECDLKENPQKMMFYTKVSFNTLLQEKKYIVGYKNSVLPPYEDYQILEF